MCDQAPSEAEQLTRPGLTLCCKRVGAKATRLPRKAEWSNDV